MPRGQAPWLVAILPRGSMRARIISRILVAVLDARFIIAAMKIVDELFALHITWTTYGSRLPGDERGYVSNTFIPGEGYRRKQNSPGTPCDADDSATRDRARKLQEWATVLLTKTEAIVVAQSLVETAKRYGWQIPRAAIMANHIHVVIMDCPADGPKVRRVLKGNTQAKLSTHHGSPRVWWTDSGSDRYKNGQEAIDTAIQYVADQEFKLVEIIDMQVVVCD